MVTFAVPTFTAFPVVLLVKVFPLHNVTLNASPQHTFATALLGLVTRPPPDMELTSLLVKRNVKPIFILVLQTQLVFLLPTVEEPPKLLVRQLVSPTTTLQQLLSVITVDCKFPKVT